MATDKTESMPPQENEPAAAPQQEDPNPAPDTSWVKTTGVRNEPPVNEEQR